MPLRSTHVRKPTNRDRADVAKRFYRVTAGGHGGETKTKRLCPTVDGFRLGRFIKRLVENAANAKHYPRQE